MIDKSNQLCKLNFSEKLSNLAYCVQNLIPVNDQSLKLGRGRQWMRYGGHQRRPSNIDLFRPSRQSANRSLGIIAKVHTLSHLSLFSPLKPSSCQKQVVVRSIAFQLKDQTPSCDKSERFGVCIPTIETLHIMPEGMQ